MYPGTGFYGIKETLLNHAKLPSFLPLPIAVQHGWQRKAHEYESSSCPPEIWVWSDRLAKDLEQFYPKARIRVTGSFFCYVESVKSANLTKVKKSGSICIPPHSSKLAESVYSVEEFASKLNDLDDQYKPIRVMLYYLDKTDEAVAAYEKYGFDVVSNGEIDSQDFIHNFINHIEGKKYCIFSELGSGVFYSSYYGLKPVQIDVKHQNVNRGCTFTDPEFIKESYEMDKAFLLQLDNKAFIDAEMGATSMLSSRQLRMVLLRNYFTLLFIKRAVKLLAFNVLKYLELRNKVR